MANVCWADHFVQGVVLHCICFRNGRHVWRCLRSTVVPLTREFRKHLPQLALLCKYSGFSPLTFTTMGASPHPSPENTPPAATPCRPPDPISFVQMCMDICIEGGYTYSGTQYGHQCFCGGEDTDHLKHGESADCDMPCAGDENEMCGGRWCMSVREML